MSLFLLLLLVAVILGAVGLAVKGLIYLLIIGVVVLVVDFVVLGARLGRSRRRRPR